VASNLPLLHLRVLGTGMPALTPVRGLMMAEAAAVCFEDRSHASGVKVAVIGDEQRTFAIGWDAVTQVQRNSYADLDEAAEHGAYGVAILLVREMTGKKALMRSHKGPGFDYWIGDTDDDELIFSNKARLEVSGIKQGDDKTIGARFRTKVRQVKPSDNSGYPAYIAVIEFGQPKARIELK